MPTLPPTLDWLFYVIAGAICICALVLLIWSLFRDRARRRAKYRCPKCWYDLTPADKSAPALPIMCSECGRSTAKLKRLRRTHRRWGRAAVAIVMVVVSGLVAYYPSAQRKGWWWAAPTRFLIDTMPVFGYPSSLTKTLESRLRSMSVLGSGTPPTGPDADREYEQIALIARRVAEGTPGARPFSERWLRSYGAFVRKSGWIFLAPTQAMSTELHDALQPLVKLQPEVTTRTRDIWPKDVPLWISTEISPWYSGVWRGIEVMPSGKSALNGVTIPPVQLATAGDMTLDFRVRWGIGHIEPGNSALFQRSTAYRIEGSLKDHMHPVVDPALDSYVKSIVQVDRGRISLNQWGFTASFSTDVALGMIVEYSHDGAMVARQRIWWCNKPNQRGGHELLTENDSEAYEVYQVRPSGEHWTIRIRSDPETALRVLDADRYWEGDVTVDITIP